MIQEVKHETKACPRCGQAFECRVGDILKCQCYGIHFSDEEQTQLAAQFSECLSRSCLLNLKHELSATPVVFCWSGGKDSAYALYQLMQTKKYHVKYLLSTFNAETKRLSMHGVREELIEAQVKSIGIPLIKVYLHEGSNEEYEKQMRRALEKLKTEGIFDVAYGDIFLEDLRQYREEKNTSVGFKSIFPLWKKDTKNILDDFLQKGFKTITCCVSDEKLSKDFCGRIIDETFINQLPENVDPCGENGAYHSFCFNGPIFKPPVDFKKGEIIHKTLELQSKGTGSDPGFWYCDLLKA